MKRYPFPKRDAGLRRRHTAFVIAQIQQLPIERDWVVEIKQLTKDRTPPQNRYLHALIGEISKATGMPAEDCKDALVLRFCGVAAERRVGDTTLIERVRTSKLNTADCATLCDQIRVWASDYLGLLLPLPEEFHE